MNSKDVGLSLLCAMFEGDFDKAYALLDQIKEHSKEVKVYEKEKAEFTSHEATWNTHYHVHISNKVFHRIIDEILMFVHGGKTKKKES